VLALLASAAADAGPAERKPIDASAASGKLDGFRDDLGNIYLLPRPGAFPDKATEDQWVFFGDGKTEYRQRLVGSNNTDKVREWVLWAPRVKGMDYALLERHDGKMLLKCRGEQGWNNARTLVALPADEVQSLLKRVKLMPMLWTREAHVLARDDDAVYYYVDKLMEEAGGNGYRLFVGQTGAMKEIAITNLAVDTAGEIFTTKIGTLKIAGKQVSAAWLKGGGKKLDLTLVDVEADRYLIYRGLGMYGQLGLVCEDL
jgi:hypothetical protein